MKNKVKIFSIIFLSFVISSCSKVTYEKIKTSVEENCFEKTEKLLLKCNSLTEDEMLELADISFQKNYSFDVIRLLCEKGLDVNSRITDNSSITPKPQSFDACFKQFRKNTGYVLYKKRRCRSFESKSCIYTFFNFKL